MGRSSNCVDVATSWAAHIVLGPEGFNVCSPAGGNIYTIAVCMSKVQVTGNPTIDASPAAHLLSLSRLIATDQTLSHPILQSSSQQTLQNQKNSILNFLLCLCSHTGGAILLGSVYGADLLQSAVAASVLGAEVVLADRPQSVTQARLATAMEALSSSWTLPGFMKAYAEVGPREEGESRGTKWEEEGELK